MELHILSQQEKLIQGQGSIIEGQVNIVQGQEAIIQGQENLHTTLTENTAELLGINKQQLVSLQVMNISLEQIVKKQRCVSSICLFYFDSVALGHLACLSLRSQEHKHLKILTPC